MPESYYQKAERFVLESFDKGEKSGKIRHFIRTVDWVKYLKPDADEALLVAAVAHDIEKAFRQPDVVEKQNVSGNVDLAFLRLHEERGAEIIGDFLKKQGAPEAFVERVKMLVSRHEEGGSDDQNVLKDADSISFFEDTALDFINKNKEKGIEKLKAKCEWMFERITSKKGRDIARQWYEDTIRLLGQ